MITHIYTYVIILTHSIERWGTYVPKYTEQTFLGGKIIGKFYLLYPFALKTIKHFIFSNKKEPVPTSSPSLVKNALQERRRWKFQIKRGNREIRRRRQSQQMKRVSVV